MHKIYLGHLHSQLSQQIPRNIFSFFHYLLLKCKSTCSHTDTNECDFFNLTLFSLTQFKLGMSLMRLAFNMKSWEASGGGSELSGPDAVQEGNKYIDRALKIFMEVSKMLFNSRTYGNIMEYLSA